jgi:alkylation response protein AidB-like acyl-CoA dehydrogenase
MPVHATFSPEEEAFRLELRGYLERTIDPRWHEAGFWKSISPDEGFARRRMWERDKAAAGYAGIDWPVEYGGRGGTPGMQAVYDQEMAAAGAPRSANQLGLVYLAPTIAAIGTDEQKRDIIGPMLRNETIWVQGFSEPEAGSDLASVRTSGVRDGDEFVVNGQKIWTTQAKYGDRIFALVRTEPGSSRHQGLSLLLIDMHQAGVQARPLKTMSGELEFGEVFFTDARVPVADCLGGIGNGWRTAMLLLSFERGASGFAFHASMRRMLTAMLPALRLARDGAALADPAVRQRFGAVLTDVECLRYHAMSVLTRIEQGHDLGFEASMTKLHWSETMQDLWEAFDEALGPDATVADPFVGEGIEHLQTQALYSRSVTIWGGSAQIQRNVIAERVLALPR